MYIIRRRSMKRTRRNPPHLYQEQENLHPATKKLPKAAFQLQGVLKIIY